MGADHNQCAGPFGAVYSLYIERPRLAGLIGQTVWGIDLKPMYRSMEAIGRAPAGAVVVDVPCGSGVALRELRPDQDVTFLALDIEEAMLDRTRRRATRSGLAQVSTIPADMRRLPLDDESADLVCCYSGLHMIDEPESAVRELARILRPGGTLVGATFITGGTRRQRLLFAAEERRGTGARPFASEDLAGWLSDAGLAPQSIEGRGFVVFHADKPAEQTPASRLEVAELRR